MTDSTDIFIFPDDIKMNYSVMPLQWLQILVNIKPRHRATEQSHGDLEKEMWTAGFKYNWRKKEEAAKDTAGWRQVVCHLYTTDSYKA